MGLGKSISDHRCGGISDIEENVFEAQFGKSLKNLA
jgi:hypothetical protein